MFSDPQYNQYRLSNEIAEKMRLNPLYVKYELEGLPVRRIFKNVPYDKFELKQLQDFKSQLGSQASNDDVLLRHLYDTHFDMKQAAESHHKQITWLKDQTTLPNITIELFVHYYHVIYCGQKQGVVYLQGRDKLMRPIIVLQLSKIKEDKVEASEAILIMCLFVEQVMFCAGKVESFVVILDFEASNLADFQAQVIGSVVSNLLTHFVNLLDEMYIINSTPSLELTLKWNMVKKYLPRQTFQKIQFLKKEEIPMLLHIITPDQLDVKFGGTKKTVYYWPPNLAEVIIPIVPLDELPMLNKEQEQVKLPVVYKKPPIPEIPIIKPEIPIIKPEIPIIKPEIFVPVIIPEIPKPVIVPRKASIILEIPKPEIKYSQPTIYIPQPEIIPVKPEMAQPKPDIAQPVNVSRLTKSGKFCNNCTNPVPKKEPTLTQSDPYGSFETQYVSRYQPEVEQIEPIKQQIDTAPKISRFLRMTEDSNSNSRQYQQPQYQAPEDSSFQSAMQPKPRPTSSNRVQQFSHLYSQQPEQFQTQSSIMPTQSDNQNNRSTNNQSQKFNQQLQQSLYNQQVSKSPEPNYRNTNNNQPQPSYNPPQFEQPRQTNNRSSNNQPNQQSNNRPSNNNNNNQQQSNYRNKYDQIIDTNQWSRYDQ